MDNMELLRKTNKREVTTVYGNDRIHHILRNLVNPVKYNLYRLLWNEATKLCYTPKHPLQIDFELNESCNLSCPTCSWSLEKGKYSSPLFDLSDYQEIVKDGVAKGLKAVRLNYINEPLMRKDIGMFIRIGRNLDILDIYLSTNGSLLDEQMARELIHSGLMRLQVSLDAVTKETYNKVRVGGDFDKILQNIESFKRVRKELDSSIPILRVNFIKMEANRHELDTFVEYWADKADSIGIQDLIAITNLKTEIPEKPPEFYCAHPFSRATVRCNGDILPCCSFFGKEIPIGNIKEGSISEAWNNDKTRFFREIHKKGEYWKHPVCKKCVLSTEHA